MRRCAREEAGFAVRGVSDGCAARERLTGAGMERPRSRGYQKKGGSCGPFFLLEGS